MAAKSSEMNQETAQQLFIEGATLVFLGVPEGTEFGIDYNSWTVGSQFKGVKMIPPGIHFVYYSAVNKEGQVAPRTGFFHNFLQTEVLVKKWDPQLEDISGEPVSGEEQERIECNKVELDRYLGAYPYESYKKWVSLTNHMSAALVDRLQPQSGKIYSVTQFLSEASTTQSRSEDAKQSQGEPPPKNREGDNRLPELKVETGTQIRFTEIPKQKYPSGASAVEITKYSMDHSYTLQSLLDSGYMNSYEDLLGELQFAFICFLIGQVYDGFDQWKRLVHLLCSCDEALNKHPELFRQFIAVLHYQVYEIPEDFFVDIISTNNFLTSTLQVFFSNLDTEGTNDSLKSRGLKFRDHLERKFKWDFTSDPEDELPVLVE